MESNIHELTCLRNSSNQVQKSKYDCVKHWLFFIVENIKIHIQN